MQWHILGAGAIGCLWAHCLIKAKQDVRIILRNEAHLHTYKTTSGLHYTDMDARKSHSFPQAELPNDAASITRLFITTKAFSTHDAIDSIRHRLVDNAHIVLLQNGMGQHEQVCNQLPHCHVWGASSTDGAYLTSPFHVTRAGKGETIIGLLSQYNRLSDFPLLLPEKMDDLTVHLTQNISLHLWRKLAINAAINPLTALLDCRNGALSSVPAYRQKVSIICKEIEAIAESLHQPLFEDSLEKHVFSVAELTANNFSSMHQDVTHKRKTEIDYINGFIQAQSALKGLDTPFNKQLITSIQAKPHS